VPDLRIPVKGLDLSGGYDIVIHYKSGAVSRYQFTSLPQAEQPSFYLHVCGPGKTLYAAVYLNDIRNGERYPVGVNEKMY